MPKGREARAARAIRKREPKLIESDRNLLGVRGPSSSLRGVQVLRDLLSLKKPDARMLGRKNDIRPFEDVSSLEFLCERNDCSAFAYTSSSKKRPDNVIFGRMFDHHILDMVEMGVVDFAPLQSLKGPKARIGSQSAFIFQGDAWGREESLKRLQNLILDVWAGRDVTKLSLAGLDHVIVLTAFDSEQSAANESSSAVASGAVAGSGQYRGAIHWRTYFMSFSRSGGTTPKVELIPMGPSIDFLIRRTQFASDDLFRSACRQPAA